MKRALLGVAVVLTLALIVATALALAWRRRETARIHEEEERHKIALEALHIVEGMIHSQGATTDVFPGPWDGQSSDVSGFDALSIALGFRVEGAIDPWGRELQYRRPGPVHRDGWDLFSLGPDGKGTDRTLYVGETYVPPAPNERVQALYDKETRERLAELREVVAKLPTKPASQDLKELLAALKGAGLEARRARFMDLWGNYLRWACPGHIYKGWDLYSVGPNGEDEHGAGDDIVVGDDNR
jgi:hypothetical protein